MVFILGEPSPRKQKVNTSPEYSLMLHLDFPDFLHTAATAVAYQIYMVRNGVQQPLAHQAVGWNMPRTQGTLNT